MNTKSKSIINAVTWTILALLVTTIVCFAVLGSWLVSIAVGILSALSETLFYYIHERESALGGWQKSG